MSDVMEFVMKNLVQPDGYKGPFIRLQAKGAIPNGTRIYKRGSNEGDHTLDGTPGTILGSFDAGEVILEELGEEDEPWPEGYAAGDASPVSGFNYFVVWDRDKKLPIMLNERKISRDIPSTRNEAPSPSGPRS